MKVHEIKSSIKIVKALALATTICLSAHKASSAASLIAGFNVLPRTNSFTPSPFNPVSSDPNFTIGGWTLGSGVTGTTTTNVWGGSGFTNVDEASAVSLGHTTSFTVTPN